MNLKEAKGIAGTLAITSKMPCNSTSIPAKYCQTGRKMAKIKGSICNTCYGYSFDKDQGKGNYNFPNVKVSQQKRYDGITHPEWVEAMVLQITVASIVNDTNYFRIHDLGDIQSLEHLENWVEVAKRLPSIKFWMPTRELQYLYAYKTKHGTNWPKNLIIRLSETFIRNHQLVDASTLENNIMAMERHAKNLNVVISGVDSKLDFTVTDKNFFACQAYGAKKETGTSSCGDCRACWDTNVKRVVYPAH